MRWKSLITHNFWPKLISLVLAVATWFYVFDLVNIDSFVQKKETVEDDFTRYSLVVRELPVKPVFSGKSPEGYRVVFDKVKVVPSSISVFAPEAILNEVTELRTDKVDLGEYTRSVQLRLGLAPENGAFKLDDKVVDVFIPIEAVAPEEGKGVQRSRQEGAVSK